MHRTPVGVSSMDCPPIWRSLNRIVGQQEYKLYMMSTCCGYQIHVVNMGDGLWEWICSMCDDVVPDQPKESSIGNTSEYDLSATKGRETVQEWLAAWTPFQAEQFKVEVKW